MTVIVAVAVAVVHGSGGNNSGDTGVVVVMVVVVCPTAINIAIEALDIGGIRRRCRMIEPAENQACFPLTYTAT